MTTFSANRCILCEGHKADNVCLKLAQQVCCKSIKLMLEYFAELGPLRVMVLVFVFSCYYSYFPCCYHLTHLLLMFVWPKLKLEQDFLTSYMFLTLPRKITTKMQQHSCHQLYICLKSYRLGTKKSAQNHLQHKNN